VVRRNDPDRTKEHHMPTYSIDAENNLAVHPGKDAAIKEAGAAGAAFATEAKLGETTALWPASRLVDVWNGFAGAPLFSDLTEVKKFKDRKTAVARIWAAAQRLGKALEQETAVAIAKQRDESAAKAAQAPKAAPTVAPKLPAAEKATKRATSTNDARAPKPRKGTRKATVIALVEREGGATLEELMAATSWQAHSVRGFISTLASKHGYTIVSTRREADKARVYAIAN
jgi:hypothetical protein